MLAVHFADEAAPDTAAALGRFRIAARRPPGRRVEYRNVNYALLGEVVSRVSGRPFTSYVRERLLEPLGMKAAFSSRATASAYAATGYMGAWEPARFLFRLRFPKTARRLIRSRIGGLIELAPYDLDTAAIGGLVGPVTGFLPFVLAQLNGGRGILSQASTALMQTLQARGRAGIEARLGVGLGWKIGETAGRRFLNHEGGGAGFTSETRIYPREGLGMVIAMNRLVGTKSCSLAHRICEALCDARELRRDEAPKNSFARVALRGARPDRDVGSREIERDRWLLARALAGEDRSRQQQDAAAHHERHAEPLHGSGTLAEKKIAQEHGDERVGRGQGHDDHGLAVSEGQVEEQQSDGHADAGKKAVEIEGRLPRRRLAHPQEDRHGEAAEGNADGDLREVDRKRRHLPVERQLAEEAPQPPGEDDGGG